jgi:hypothetical protein
MDRRSTMRNWKESFFMSILLLLSIITMIAVISYRAGQESREPTKTIPEGQASENKCQEDQPCWDCKTMGNRICGDKIYIDNKEYMVNDSERPGCFIEPRPGNGYVIVKYPHLSEVPDSSGGFEVVCS